ncbi:MAG: GNAT family N-acetyltransferase [Lachnospiraceae bacterium]|nr:GNAT family N-acetyltransferase [Lachnospiraceae bacterium]
MLKAIIFDMDGVIIDSEPQHGRAALNVFRKYGAVADDSYHEQFIGSSTENMIETVIKEFHFSISAEELLNEVETEKRKLLKEEGYTISPGITELLKNLYQNGYHVAIASSSTPSEIERAVKALGIKKYFKKLISSSQVKNPKPAPDTFLYALKELGVKAEEAMVVEDSQFGAEAAKAAGITCVGYVNPHSGRQDLKSADVLLESFETIDYRFFKNVHKRSNGIPITIADTKHLVISEMSVKDVAMMYEIYKDPEVRKYVPEIDEYMEFEIEKQAAYIRNVYSFYGYGIWGVYSKTSKALIGRCGIENQMVDGKAEITLSYLLDKEHWGFGYALECCRAVFEYAKTELDIKRIVAVIDKENTRSIETAKNLGMAFEKDIEYKGRDCVLYAISL